MKRSRHLWLPLLLFLLFPVNSGECAGPFLRAAPAEYIQAQPSQVPRENPNAPILLQAAVIDRGYYGTILRIYLEARDPDGDMLQIATSVKQAGYTRYSTDYIMLDAPDREYFKGYIQWNTSGSRASRLPEWTHIVVNVSVMDRAGNGSYAFEFPFTFETGTGEPPPPPEPFQGKLPRLGYISIDLVNPDEMDNDNSFDLSD